MNLLDIYRGVGISAHESAAFYILPSVSSTPVGYDPTKKKTCLCTNPIDHCVITPKKRMDKIWTISLAATEYISRVCRFKICKNILFCFLFPFLFHVIEIDF